MTVMLTFIMNTINKEPASKSQVRPVQKGFTGDQL